MRHNLARPAVLSWCHPVLRDTTRNNGCLIKLIPGHCKCGGCISDRKAWYVCLGCRTKTKTWNYTDAVCMQCQGDMSMVPYNRRLRHNWKSCFIGGSE